MKKTYIEPCASSINILATTILSGSEQEFTIDDTTPHKASEFGAKNDVFLDFDDDDLDEE